jgi:transposase InsO family protein
VHPRWGARRSAFEIAQRGIGRAPSRATVHRVLERNGLVVPQAQRHKRKYKRWQRETPMALWQLDLVGGIYLADGRECKLLSGIDDHSRFVVCAAVLAIPSGRAVADAFTAAMKTYGVPSEVLTDIQDGWCLRKASHYPAGGVRLFVTGARPSSLLTDRSTHERDFLPVDHRDGRGRRRGAQGPVENPVTGSQAGSLLANVWCGLLELARTPAC